MSTKRQSIDGFTPETTPTRITKMKDWEPAGKWRAFGIVRVPYTYLNRVWSRGGYESTEVYLCPMGMLEAISKRLSNKKCYNTFNVLPEQVKLELDLSENNFKEHKGDILLTVQHEGSKGYGTFDHIFCKDCKTKVVPDLFLKHGKKLPADPKIDDLIANCYNSDVCGCLIPKEAHVKGGPSARRFIVRPAEHANTVHLSKKKTEAVPSVLNSSGKKRQTTLDTSVGGNLSTSSKTTTTLVSENKQSSITLKHGKKMKMMRVDKLLDTSLSITEKSEDDIDFLNS